MERQRPIVIGASFKKGHVEVNYKERFIDDAGKLIEIAAPGAVVEHPPHPDLLLAVAALSPHFANLCEQLHVDPSADAEEGPENPIAQRFPVRGIKFKENEQGSGVTIHGFRRLASKQVVNMKAPYVKFNDPNGSYPHLDLFEEQCEQVRSELALFLEGKRGEDPQQEMQFPPADQQGDDGKADEHEDDQQGQPGTPDDCEAE